MLLITETKIYISTALLKQTIEKSILKDCGKGMIL